jgi:hypothetical protein
VKTVMVTAVVFIGASSDARIMLTRERKRRTSVLMLAAAWQPATTKLTVVETRKRASRPDRERLARQSARPLRA